MEIEKHECVVLKSIDYKDNDKILTLFAKDLGHITAQARGAKRVKSPLLNTTQILSCGEFEFSVSKERYYLTSVYLKHDFSYIHKDYEKYTTACVMTELTEIIVRNSDDLKNLYSLFVNCLFYMQDNPHYKCLAYFFVRITEILGIIPSTSNCVLCGNPAKESLKWSSIEGGVVCKQCTGGTKVQAGTIKGIREIFKILPSKMELLTETDFKKIVLLMYNYVNIQTDIKLKSVKYLTDEPNKSICKERKDIV